MDYNVTHTLRGKDLMLYTEWKREEARMKDDSFDWFSIYFPLVFVIRWWIFPLYNLSYWLIIIIEITKVFLLHPYHLETLTWIINIIFLLVFFFFLEMVLGLCIFLFVLILKFHLLELLLPHAFKNFLFFTNSLLFSKYRNGWWSFLLRSCR